MRLPGRREPGARALLLAVTGFLLAAAAPARALDPLQPASGGALRITADPPRLVLGRDGGTDLTIAAPPEVEQIAVATSAGRVENVRRLPKGGFVARLRAPAERYPQVAIVAALGRAASGPVDGWIVVPLYGQGDARVRADPGTSITLRIGDRAFGPRSAGRDGLAVIPVVVPPGVREAHHGFKPIDLHVPETPLLLALADRSTVRADRAEQVRVLAFVVAPHGAARRGDVPVFEPSRGSVAVTAREPGAYEAVWTLPPGPAGDERVAVRLPGSAPSHALLHVGATPGTPATIAVTFDRDAVVADAARPVGVVVRALDAAGNATAASLEVRAQGGTLSALAERQPGVYEARLDVDPRFEGRDLVIVSATAAAPALSGAGALPLRPGAPASASLGDAVVVADGRREAALRVVVRDRFDNPGAVTPAVSARLGRVAGVALAGPGVYRVRYVGPAVETRTADPLTLEVGPVRTGGEVVLVPPRSPLAVLASAGIVAHAPAGARVGLGVELDGPELPGFEVGWRFESELSGWPSDDLLRPRHETSRARAVALLAGASASRTLATGPTIWGSATGGLLVGSVSGGGASDTRGGPAARLAVGAGWRQRRWTPFVEASLLAAGGAPMSTFPLFALSAGVRVEVERSHGDHPDRR